MINDDTFEVADWITEDIKKLAEDYIMLYFGGLELFSGGEIPRSILKSSRYVSLVLNTNMNIGVDAAHLSLGEPTAEEVKNVERNGAIFNSTEKIIGVLSACSRARVPKCFAPGMMLMHLELCEGIDCDIPEFQPRGARSC